MGRQYRDVVLFGTLYLVVSLPPFLFLNQEIISQVRQRFAIDVVTVAVLGTVLCVLISALFLADEGIGRYNQFLLGPTDALSIFVGASFLLASMSWWLVPELVFRYSFEPTLDILLLLILFCQIPMVIFLSLLTAISKA